MFWNIEVLCETWLRPASAQVSCPDIDFPHESCERRIVNLFEVLVWRPPLNTLPLGPARATVGRVHNCSGNVWVPREHRWVLAQLGGL
jgi:hypothetical protein